MLNPHSDHHERPICGKHGFPFTGLKKKKIQGFISTASSAMAIPFYWNDPVFSHSSLAKKHKHHPFQVTEAWSLPLWTMLCWTLFFPDEVWAPPTGIRAGIAVCSIPRIQCSACTWYRLGRDVLKEQTNEWTHLKRERAESMITSGTNRKGGDPASHMAGEPTVCVSQKSVSQGQRLMDFCSAPAPAQGLVGSASRQAVVSPVKCCCAPLSHCWQPPSLQQLSKKLTDPLS